MDGKRSKLLRISKAEWIILGVSCLIPFVFHSTPYLQGLLIFILLWVILGTSWNLLAGFTGQVSFGHAAFFGVGAYAAAIPMLHFKISPWWGLLTGGACAVLLGYFLGLLVFRLRGPYFALGTLASGEILRLVFGEEQWLTNGHVGILYMTTWVSKYPYYFIALVLAAGAVGSIKFIMKTKAGFYFLSIREDEDAAAAIGINTLKYKNVAMAISTFWAGTAGAFYMIYMGFIDPEVVFALHHISIITILVGIIGGVGTVWGPAIGALIMVFVQEMFRSALFGLAPQWVSGLHTFIFGVLVIVVILYLPGGIIGDWKTLIKKLRRAIRMENRS